MIWGRYECQPDRDDRRRVPMSCPGSVAYQKRMTNETSPCHEKRGRYTCQPIGMTGEMSPCLVRAVL